MQPAARGGERRRIYCRPDGDRGELRWIDPRKTLVFVSTDGDRPRCGRSAALCRGYGDIDRVQDDDRPQPAGRHAPAPAAVDPVVYGSPVDLDRARQDGGAGDHQTRPAGRRPTRTPSPSSSGSRSPRPGEQAPLIEDGFDSVRISSSGELPRSRSTMGPRTSRRLRSGVRPCRAGDDARPRRRDGALRARAGHLRRAVRQPRPRAGPWRWSRSA